MLAASALSVTGNILTMLAVPWFVLDTTGSAGLTGLAAFATTFPIVVSAAFGGTIVDWMGFRGASVVSDLASGLIVLAIPVLFVTTGLSYQALLLLLFVRWLAATPGETARKAMVPDLSALGRIRLERATAACDGVSRGATMVAAPLAGVLILWLGPTVLLLFDAITFLLSAALIGLGVPRVGHERGPREPGDSGGYVSDLRDGMTFLWRDRLQMSATTMIVVTNMLDTGVTQVLLALYAREATGDPRAFGLLTGALGAGAVAGAIVYGAAGERLPRRLTYGCCFLIAGVPRILVLALGAPFPVALAVTALSGFAAGAINPILGVLQFDRIPVRLRARVLSSITAAAYAGMPVGGLLAGSLTELTGLTFTLSAFACVYLLASVPPFVFRAWRELDPQQPAST
ncbi:macrolide resistance MFS transporter Mrx(A) [Nonomuraea rosea]|uniref:Macrolide resistance MFS transporter Mrx(A) n=1 Tax=Nonomuraea rosea TaxID=638574 RepID=A0ABP6WB74_9ACTN